MYTMEEINQYEPLYVHVHHGHHYHGTTITTSIHHNKYHPRVTVIKEALPPLKSLRPQTYKHVSDENHYHHHTRHHCSHVM